MAVGARSDPGSGARPSARRFSPLRCIDERSSAPGALRSWPCSFRSSWSPGEPGAGLSASSSPPNRHPILWTSATVHMIGTCWTCGGRSPRRACRLPRRWWSSFTAVGSEAETNRASPPGWFPGAWTRESRSPQRTTGFRRRRRSRPPCATAPRVVQFLRFKATELGIDPARIAASGSSAGAGIALWVGFHDDLADPKSADPVAAPVVAAGLPGSRRRRRPHTIRASSSR